MRVLSTVLLVLGAVGCVLGTEVICYWASWTSYRTGHGKVTVDDLDPTKCTIYIYAFATLDERTLTMQPFDIHLDIDQRGYERFVALKERNPRLRVLLALGGYNDSGPKYSRMLASRERRNKFVRRAVALLRQYGFDGLDLDYEYPTAADKPHFAKLVAELKRAFRPYDMWLSTATPATRERIDEGFDVPAIASEIDMIHVMAYDFHGSWESTADHHSPLLPRASDNGRGFDVETTVHHWLRRGAPAAKLALGVPLYGRSWTVPGPDKRPSVAAGTGPGRAGPYSREPGTLTYLEICEKIHDGWNAVQDPSGRAGPHAFSGDQWVGFDDPSTAARKTLFALSLGLGGMMVWDVGSEDVRDVCGGGPWPMLTAINAYLELAGSATAVSPTQRPAVTARPTQVTTVVNTGAGAGRFTCPRPNGLYPDPYSCRRFFFCQNGKAESTACPANTGWDSQIGACNWLYNIDCQD
ncbi:Chitotriosidase-1 [Amphibalanus amphitrite]|uniref:Chitotriosidase-1 n=1 Tax=Amphibalanus amphitrite TaxID=1232801 RepID=A0A6A4VVF4_AMPAM|nr:Chitotriosidase-1 [Amphibalanus amphitrite]